MLSIALSTFFLVGCRGSGNEVPPNPAPNISRILVHQSELIATSGWSFEQFAEQLKVEREYSYVVVVGEAPNFAPLQRLHVQTIDFDAETVMHELVDQRWYSIDMNEHIGLDQDGHLFARDFYNKTIDEIVTIRIIQYWPPPHPYNVFVGMYIRLRVIRNP